MDRRQDALVAAAAVVSEVNQRAGASNGQYVATVGKLDVSPNATNIIPGCVRLVIETRSPKPEVLEAIHTDIPRMLNDIGARFGVRTELTRRLYAKPAPLHASMIAALQAAAEQAQLGGSRRQDHDHHRPHGYDLRPEPEGDQSFAPGGDALGGHRRRAQAAGPGAAKLGGMTSDRTA
jgi:metal-dependent amidase/aminoacylase/carboxypeptidase family protein